MTKEVLLILMLVCIKYVPVRSQTITPAVTVYKEFRPATVWLSDGRKMNLPLANIFLKNSSLLYKSGVDTKEANKYAVMRVDFKDRVYLRMDSLLAYRVDTLGSDGLFCAERIDMETYRQQVANNREFTSIDFGDQLGYTTVDIQDERDIHFPIQSIYYLRIGGRTVLAHERQLQRILSKPQRRLLESVMSDPGFSWKKEESLIRLLHLLHN